MKKYQLAIYKITLLFSVLINLFLIVILCIFIKDSVMGNGDFFFTNRNLYYFSAIILAFTIFNTVFILELKKTKNRQEK